MSFPSLSLLSLTFATAHTEQSAPWRLAALYDLSSVSALEAGASGSGPVWTPTPEMTRSCGPAKAPDGLGVFEAEAMAAGLTPTLAILLRREPEAPARPLLASEVRVSLQQGEQRVLLQPASLPRALRVEISGGADGRQKQLLQTMLQTELCLEHKVGRAWIGGLNTQGALREAFLLDPPANGRNDRRFFGGQRDPVPALLGPPDACFAWSGDLEADEGEASSKRVPGEASLDLIPSDIWGASIRWCGEGEDAPAPSISQPRPFPLTTSLPRYTAETPQQPNTRWQRLILELNGGPKPEDVQLLATLDSAQPGTRPTPLTSGPTALIREDPETGKQGLLDVLAMVPKELPWLGWESEPYAYTLVLIPAWQVEEGLGRLALGDSDTPLAGPRAMVRDGVGWVLDHPEVLHVQIAPTGTQPDLGAAGEEEMVELVAARWPDLMEPGGRIPRVLRTWGFPAGLLSGREPVALLGTRLPDWEQISKAQRSTYHSLFLGSALVSLLFATWGARRLRDLWSVVPEERVDYWPGADAGEDVAPGAAAPAAPATSSAPAAPAASAGEKT